SRGPRDVDRSRHAGGTRQRPQLWDAHARHRGRGAAHPPALRARVETVGLFAGPTHFPTNKSFPPAITYNPSVVAGFLAVCHWSHVAVGTVRAPRGHKETMLRRGIL